MERAKRRKVVVAAAVIILLLCATFAWVALALNPGQVINPSKERLVQLSRIAPSIEYVLPKGLDRLDLGVAGSIEIEGVWDGISPTAWHTDGTALTTSEHSRFVTNHHVTAGELNFGLLLVSPLDNGLFTLEAQFAIHGGSFSVANDNPIPDDQITNPHRMTLSFKVPSGTPHVSGRIIWPRADAKWERIAVSGMKGFENQNGLSCRETSGMASLLFVLSGRGHQPYFVLDYPASLNGAALTLVSFEEMVGAANDTYRFPFPEYTLPAHTPVRAQIGPLTTFAGGTKWYFYARPMNHLILNGIPTFAIASSPTKSSAPTVGSP